MTREQAKMAIYREHQVMTASPIDLVIMTYDVIIVACAQQDMERALRGLSQLRRALDWEAAPDFAPRLHALYEYFESCIREGDFDTPVPLLRDLRNAWAEARSRLNNSKLRTATPAVGAMAVGAGGLNLAS
ncbi:MAG: flagellar export chaperone FliS [Anaerolineae bacterium]